MTRQGWSKTQTRLVTASVVIIAVVALVFLLFLANLGIEGEVLSCTFEDVANSVPGC